MHQNGNSFSLTQLKTCFAVESSLCTLLYWTVWTVISFYMTFFILSFVNVRVSFRVTSPVISIMIRWVYVIFKFYTTSLSENKISAMKSPLQTISRATFHYLDVLIYFSVTYYCFLFNTKWQCETEHCIVYCLHALFPYIYICCVLLVKKTFELDWCNK